MNRAKTIKIILGLALFGAYALSRLPEIRASEISPSQVRQSFSLLSKHGVPC